MKKTNSNQKKQKKKTWKDISQNKLCELEKWKCFQHQISKSQGIMFLYLFEWLQLKEWKETNVGKDMQQLEL